MTVTVRTASMDDSELLHRLAAATFALACPPGTTEADVRDFVSHNLSTEHFAAYTTDPGRQVLIAERDGAAAGYSMLVYRDTEDADVIAALTTVPSAELSKLYVLGEHHGAGIAAQLMGASVRAAADRGYASVWLGVNKLNARANRFYEKQGFRVVGSKTFLLAGRREDDHVREHIVTDADVDTAAGTRTAAPATSAEKLA
ncbi:MAG: GNAT family N-acetyltransferase [Glaciihabitans sp.]